jgi:predicted SnoaL-like aldol condensation-catalyzing enzyme
MTRLSIRGLAMLSGAAAVLLLSGRPATAQEKLDKNAQFCEDFDQNVILGGKIEDASKYLTDDFIEHNVRLTSHGLTEFVEKLKGFRANQAGRRGGGGGGAAAGGGGRAGGGQAAAPAPRTIFSHDDVVVFMRALPDRDDPNNPGQKIPGGTHFDIYKLRNGKIAEHWD